VPLPFRHPGIFVSVRVQKTCIKKFCLVVKLNFKLRSIVAFAYPTCSPEARMETFLREERTTTAFLGTLAALRNLRGLSQTRLSAVQRGRGLENDVAKALGELLTKLDRLRNACAPIPVRFHNAAEINELLRLLDDDRLSIIVATPAE
jgi:hypothetical protein